MRRKILGVHSKLKRREKLSTKKKTKERRHRKLKTENQRINQNLGVRSCALKG